MALTYFGSALFAGNGWDNVIKSTNGGTSWSVAGTGSSGGVTSFAAIGSNLFTGSDGDNVHVTSDGGSTWTRTDWGGVHGDNAVGVTAFGTILYLACTGTGGIFKSKDNGATWTAIGLASQPNYNVLISTF
jgi:photosystem II stability/assembly factor-like uncharacterized protein